MTQFFKGLLEGRPSAETEFVLKFQQRRRRRHLQSDARATEFLDDGDDGDDDDDDDDGRGGRPAMVGANDAHRGGE